MKSIIYFSLTYSIFSCIDPVPPEFDYQPDLIVIDAMASTIPGTTYVNVKKTIRKFQDAPRTGKETTNDPPAKSRNTSEP